MQGTMTADMSTWSMCKAYEKARLLWCGVDMMPLQNHKGTSP